MHVQIFNPIMHILSDKIMNQHQSKNEKQQLQQLVKPVEVAPTVIQPDGITNQISPGTPPVQIQPQVAPVTVQPTVVQPTVQQAAAARPAPARVGGSGGNRRNYVSV